MKKIIALLLAALLLCGCENKIPAQTVAAPETAAAPETTEVSTEVTLPEEMTFPTLAAPENFIGTPEGDPISFENPGKLRVTYTGPRSYVRYVTCVEDLPQEEALKGYDEAFFEEHALLIVMETVSSGSVQLEIGGIYRDGDTATVKLNRAMSGDFGTADMATWLLWAEVSRKLDCNWILDSGVREPQGEKY
jgi:hypothetical protein